MSEELFLNEIETVIHGHVVQWSEEKNIWVYKDTKDPIPTKLNGLPFRACKKCGRICNDGPDPCLGELPGVRNACCGHGHPEKSYIQFVNGVIVRGFISEPEYILEAERYERDKNIL